MSEGYTTKVILDGDAEKLVRAYSKATAKAREFDAAVTKSEATSKRANLATMAAAEAQKKQSLSIDGAIGRLDKMSTSVGKVTMLLGGAGLVGVALQAVGAMDQLSARAMALSDVKGNLRISIDKARASTKGLVDDFTLQKTAMAGLRYGVFQSAEGMAKHVEIATTLARTLGTDSNKAVEDFTLGIARQSRLILDNLGILVDVDKANRNYERSINAATGSLNDEQKAIAFRTEAYKQAEKAIKGLKLQEDSWAVTMQQTKVALTNLLDDLLELPHNIAELSTELKNSFGISDEAAEHYALIARVGLAAITLGGSEAIIQLKELHRVMTEMPSVLGDRKGSMGFSGFTGLANRQALSEAATARAGVDVSMGLLGSANAGTAAQQEYIRKHPGKGGGKAGPSAEFLAELNRSRGGIGRDGSDSRDFSSGLMAANNAQVGSQLKRGGTDDGSAQRELDATLRLTEAERAREVQRIDFFGTQQVDFGAELARLETEREAKLAFWDEEAANATTRLELIDIQEARKQEVHEAELARIDTERAAREQEQARLKQYIGAGAQAAQQMVGGLVSITDARFQARQAALAQGKTEAQAARAAKIATLEATAGQLQALRNLAISKAIEQTALGLGALGTTWGIPNPAAMLHFASAATWAVVGVGAGIGARGVSSAASGMRGDDARAEAASSASGKGGGGVSGGSANSGGRGDTPGSDSPIPGSPGPRAPSVSGGTGFGAPQRTLVIQGDVHTYGTPKREWIRQLDEELSLQGHDRQRRSA
jgi:hypothetical protein